MESLAAAAAVIVTVVWGVALTAAGFSLGGARLIGGGVGVAGIAIAFLLGYAMPHAWAVWLPPLAASAWCVVRCVVK